LHSISTGAQQRLTARLEPVCRTTVSAAYSFGRRRTDARFTVRKANGQQLVYVFE